MTEQYEAPKRTRLNAAILGGLATVMLLAGGCAGQAATEQSGGDAPAVAESTPTKAASSAPATTPTPTPTAEPTDDGLLTIGAKTWFRYGDGVDVQVTKVEPYKWSEHAIGAKPGHKGVLVTVTIRNRSGETLGVDSAMVTLSSGPNGDQAEEVYDGNVGGGFTGSVANNKSKTARYAFAIPKAHTIVDVEVGSMNREGVHFEGRVK